MPVTQNLKTTQRNGRTHHTLKFYNREQELNFLTQKIQHGRKTAQFIVMYGMRRVGKTFLLQELKKRTQQRWKKLPVIYLLVTRKSQTMLASEWSTIIANELKLPSLNLTRVEDIFTFVLNYAQKNPVVLIVDEFQDLMYVDASIFSKLRNLWDTYKQSARITLIISGSSYSMFRKIFHDKNEPLFGRADAFLKIDPFNLATFIQVLKDYDLGYKTPEKNIKHIVDVYSMFGTFPKYLAYLVENNLLRKRPLSLFRRAFLGVDEFFRIEGQFLLTNDLGRDSDIYFSIIQALSMGAKTTTQISKQVGIKTGNVPKYLQVLVDQLGIVTKHTGLKGLGTTYYSLKNQYLAFFFYFIHRFKSLVEVEEYAALEHIFRKQYPTYRGLAFENFVRKAILEFKFIADEPLEYVGKFIQRGVEIDIIIKAGATLYAVEAKYAPQNLHQLKINDFKKKLEYLKTQLTKHNMQNLQITPAYITLLDLPNSLKKQAKAILPEINFLSIGQTLKPLP